MTTIHYYRDIAFSMRLRLLLISPVIAPRRIGDDAFALLSVADDFIYERGILLISSRCESSVAADADLLYQR